MFKFKRRNPLRGQFVLVCAPVCYIPTVTSWVDITFFCIIQRADGERERHREQWTLSSLSSFRPVLLVNPLMVLLQKWAHSWFQSVGKRERVSSERFDDLHSACSVPIKACQADIRFFWCNCPWYSVELCSWAEKHGQCAGSCTMCTTFWPVSGSLQSQSKLWTN